MELVIEAQTPNNRNQEHEAECYAKTKREKAFFESIGLVKTSPNELLTMEDEINTDDNYKKILGQLNSNPELINPLGKFLRKHKKNPIPPTSLAKNLVKFLFQKSDCKECFVILNPVQSQTNQTCQGKKRKRSGSVKIDVNDLGSCVVELEDTRSKHFSQNLSKTPLYKKDQCSWLD